MFYVNYKLRYPNFSISLNATLVYLYSQKSSVQFFTILAIYCISSNGLLTLWLDYCCFLWTLQVDVMITLFILLHGFIAITYALYVDNTTLAFTG